MYDFYGIGTRSISRKHSFVHHIKTFRKNGLVFFYLSKSCFSSNICQSDDRWLLPTLLTSPFGCRVFCLHSWSKRRKNSIFVQNFFPSKFSQAVRSKTRTIDCLEKGVETIKQMQARRTGGIRDTSLTETKYVLPSDGLVQWSSGLGIRGLVVRIHSERFTY
jgi:hypothetical protein